MKKLLYTTALATLVLLGACRIGMRHTIIIANGNNHDLKIESAGKVQFNDDNTAISHIAWGGYLNYHYDSNKLEAKNDGHGGVQYELYDGDEKLDPHGNGKSFIAQAVKMMVQKGYHSD